MFRVALVLVKSVLGSSEQVNKCPTFYETLDRLRKIPAEYMEENYLAGEVRLLYLADFGTPNWSCAGGSHNRGGYFVPVGKTPVDRQGHGEGTFPTTQEVECVEDREGPEE